MKLTTLHQINAVIDNFEIINNNFLNFINEYNYDTELANKLGISRSAFSNKKKGKRAWKVDEIIAILIAIGKKKEAQEIQKYLELKNETFARIKNKGFTIKTIFEKIGLTQMQAITREKNPSTWMPDELRNIYKVVDFFNN